MKKFTEIARRMWNNGTAAKLFIGLAALAIVCLFPPAGPGVYALGGVLGDKTKQTRTPVDMFIALRTAEDTPVTPPSLAEVIANSSETWFYCGEPLEGMPHFMVNPFSTNTNDGTPAQTGVENSIETSIIETDYDHLTNLDGFVNLTLDVLMVEKGGTKGHRLQKVSMTVGYDGKFNFKEANVVKLKLGNYGEKLTSLYDVVDLE